MLSLLSQSNRLKSFLVDCSGLLYIYIYVINVLFKIQMAITYTGIHYNGYLWSSPLSQHHPSCVQGVLGFPLHPARYEPVSTYLGPHSRRTHVPLVRHPPSLDIKANRNAPVIRRHRLAWEHQAK